MESLSEARAGAVAMAPMLIGLLPFGLVAGAAPVANGLSGWDAIGLSTIVLAGASQLAIVDVLSKDGTALVAVLTAWTVNLRMVLYSASLAPYLSHESRRRRLLAAYLLTDQVYALCVARWASRDEPGDREGRFAFFVGGGLVLWVAWQIATVAGALVGGAVPEDVPLDFAVPLVFLVLLVPMLTTPAAIAFGPRRPVIAFGPRRPAIVAGAAGGAGALAAAQLGAGPASIVVGAAIGIIAGTVTDWRAGA